MSYSADLEFVYQSLMDDRLSIRLRVKLPKQRALTTPYVTDALSDKAASVRRYAIATLTSMILTHPFGAMYGGFLNQPEWEARYQQVKEQLKRLEAKRMGPVPGAREEPATSAADVGDGESMEGEKAETDNGDIEESSNRSKPKESAVQQNDIIEVGDPALVQQPLDADDMANLTRLRLTKRYIADALEFIRQVEGSMDVLGQLLGSTSKAEVLESIEFFKVAHEYQMAGASVGHCNCYVSLILRLRTLQSGIKKMLHLIWTKDNSGTTSEEDKELKGIRQRLIECYRSLYFDPVDDSDSRQQTNRIAKNMIECVIAEARILRILIRISKSLTKDATLAELTSLEELMRTLYEDGRVDSDVVSTLWQVYCACQGETFNLSSG